MLARHGTLGRSLTLLVAVAAACCAASCRNEMSKSLDGASDAALTDAALDSAAAATPASGADAGAAPSAAPSAVEALSTLPRPTPFTGNYRCFKNGMHLEQTGTIVMSTMHKDATTDTVIVCTAIGDTCTGTVRDIHIAKTKGKKVDAVRPITLLRAAGGDVMVTVGHEQQATATTSSSSSKAAAGDQTFCPRR